MQATDKQLLAEVEKLVDKGHLDKAVRKCEDALEAQPDDDGVMQRLAELSEQSAARDAGAGRGDAAAAGLRRASELWEQLGRLPEAVRATRALTALELDGDEHAAALARVAALRQRRWMASGKRLGLVLASAALITLAAPPWDLWPLALVGLVPLTYAIGRATTGRALLLGWLFGFVINLGGNFWGAELLDRFAGMSWLSRTGALACVAAYQGMVFALWAAGVRVAERRFALSPLWAAPLLMVLCEAVVPFLFPWYLAITVWRAWPLCQVAELGGPPAVSALIVLANVIALQAGRAYARKQRPDRAVRIAAAVFVGVVALGGLRAAHVAWVRGDAPSLRVGLVQPNFGIMSMEARERHGQRFIDVLRAATDSAGADGAELVIWPESMFPFLFDRDLDREYAKGHPWALRGSYAGRLLIGVLAHPFGESYINNSAALIAADGAMRGIYDKNALLVFGEYIPFRDKFPEWAARVRAKLPDWPEIVPGEGPVVLEDGDLRVLPLICYEDILVDYVLDAVRAGDPNLLVTVANHAWFGDSVAPRQAMALAMFRGIEARRDLARSTNTGVSSVTDALGRVVVEGSLHDVPRDKPLGPEVFVEDVRLLEVFALGPYLVGLFPYGCALALVVLGWRRRRAA